MQLSVYRRFERSKAKKRIQFLVNKKSTDLLARTKKKETALTCACKHKDNMEMIQCFVDAVKEKHGKDELQKVVTFQDSNENTPFHYAVEYGKEETVRLLLRFGGEAIRIRNKDGNIPLHRAAYRKTKLNVFKLLLDGSELLSPNNAKETVVSICTRENQIEKLGLFLQAVKEKKGEKALSKVLNEPNRYGNTPLIVSASAGHLKAAKVSANLLFSLSMITTSMVLLIDSSKIQKR